MIEPPGGTWRDGFELTYADVDRLSDEYAAGLARRGVRTGDRVALVMPPGAEYLIGYLGAAKIGAVTAGVNDRLSPAEREAVLERADPALVLAAPGLGTDRFECIETAPAAAAADVLRDVRVAGAAAPRLELDETGDVAIIFTSGTTGAPKGARWTATANCGASRTPTLATPGTSAAARAAARRSRISAS